MTTQQRNILSASAAALGVASLIYLEAVATMQSNELSGLMASALVVGFGAAGVLRWYLFYEGQTLREIDTQAADVAFRWSVTLSIFVMVYAFALWQTGDIDWRTFTVFSLNVSTLSVVEWVFGRRAGANVHPHVVTLTRQRISNVQAALRYRSAMMAERKANAALTKDLRSLTSEFQAMKIRVDDLTKFKRNAGKPLRVSSVTLAIVCPECGALQAFNQRTKTPACTSCGFELSNHLTLAK